MDHLHSGSDEIDNALILVIALIHPLALYRFFRCIGVSNAVRPQNHLHVCFNILSTSSDLKRGGAAISSGSKFHF